jgi:hypothetical protein
MGKRHIPGPWISITMVTCDVHRVVSTGVGIQQVGDERIEPTDNGKKPLDPVREGVP